MRSAVLATMALFFLMGIGRPLTVRSQQANPQDRSANQPDQPTKPDQPEKLHPKLDDAQTIAKLIQQLGADQFAVREKAQTELQRMGLKAFEALFQAQSHSDIEIALRARYLIRSLKVRWSREMDSPTVKRILRGYEKLDDDERKNRVDRLIALENYEGVPVVCRLIRFEASNQLAKRCALLVMNLAPIEKKESRARVAKLIRAAAGQSRRAVIDWLLTFADTLEGLNNIDQLQPAQAAETANLLAGRWEDLIAAEHQKFTQTPHESDRFIVRDLLRWQAAFLDRRGLEMNSREVIAKSLELLQDDREQLADAVDWLMEMKAWPFIEEVAKRFSPTFGRYLVLTYRVAEAQRKQGHEKAAAQTAERAGKIDAKNPSRHLEVAFLLQDRGLFDWAEKEFRYVMAKENLGSQLDLIARELLSEMLHDQLKELAAAEVLKAVVDIFGKDPSVLRNLATRDRDPGGVRSRMHYFFSLDFAQKGDREKQREQLRLGAKSDPNDSDVLIAMHRFPDADDSWKKESLALIEKSTQYYRQEIRKYEQRLQQAPRAVERDAASRKLATAYNQFAWLVSNTVGDYDEAVRRSRQSLELFPKTGSYLDTLARCYYAKQDLENAVKHQRHAVELEPYSTQIRQQLELFEAALAKTNQRQPKPSKADAGKD